MEPFVAHNSHASDIAPAGSSDGVGAVPVIDYEGSPYKTEFWAGQGRDYEDATERLALGSLLPPTGTRIAEIGAGFGRLTELYRGYQQIVLMDYSRTLLLDAVQHWGHDPRFVFVAGNIYHLPLATGVLDSLVMVRVMHHLADVPAALAQLRRAMHSSSTAVLEYANKRNLKALARWAAQKQTWSPLDEAPVEFVELNFDFHPAWMAQRLREAGLVVQRQYGVSHFRMGAIKQRVDAQRLARVDAALFAVGGQFPLAPSVFVQVQSPGSGPAAARSTAPDDIAELFACPTCGQTAMERVTPDQVRCNACRASYARQQQIWDFKDRLE
jgi:SAM-dependent methyltransferase